MTCRLCEAHSGIEGDAEPQDDRRLGSLDSVELGRPSSKMGC